MSRPIPNKDLGRFGTVVVERNSRADEDGSSPTTFRCQWRPDHGIWTSFLDQVEFSLEFEMDCIVREDGVRRFNPSTGPFWTICRATILGDLILDVSGRTRAKDDVYTASAIQLWMIAPKLREFFNRRFKRLSDLVVPRGSRLHHNDVLPDGLGIPPGSACRRWTPTKLLKVGKEAAEHENQRPNAETCIQYGVHEAAKFDPLDRHELTTSNVRRILRHCLFDLGPSESAVDRKTRRLVRDRFIRTVQKHGDLTSAAFQRWLHDDFNNIAHQISKKTRSGGPLDRAVVRQAIVEETFEAHFAVARAMDHGMRAFAASLPTPLTKKERAIFGIWYLSQPWLGGLTLVMLRSHFPSLKPAILDVVNDLDSVEAKGVLVRLLQFYGQMASNRRDADRDAKQRQHARNVEGRPARLVAHRSNAIDSGAPRSADAINAIIEHVVESRQLNCSCRKAGQWTIASGASSVVLLN
jgi:hypothetical protein